MDISPLMVAEYLKLEFEPRNDINRGGQLYSSNHPHLVFCDIDNQFNNPLVVYLPGTASIPQSAQTFLSSIHNKGFLVVGLSYEWY
jgi:hypothetical protein